MPRPPSHPHVLRTARKILGFTQKDLADRVGIATVTLQKFENGDASISRQIALRISVETGLDVTDLIKNKDPLHPRTWVRGKEIEPGNQSRKPVFEAIQVPLTKEVLGPLVFTEEDTEEEIARLVPVIRELLNLSVKKKSFVWMSKSIQESLKEIKAEFQGGTALKQLPPKRGRPRKPVKSAKKPEPRSP
jgi:transcriptional regulator with XRE-family HTH domain